MNATQRKEIIATLIKQGRPDLANKVVALKPGQEKALNLALEGLSKASGHLRASGRLGDPFINRIEELIKEVKTVKQYM